MSNEVEVLKTALRGLKEAGLPKRIGFFETFSGSLRGIWDDGWAGPRFDVSYRALRPIDSVAVSLFVPPVAEGTYLFNLSCGGRETRFRAEAFSGEHTLTIDGLAIGTGDIFDLVLETIERPAVTPNPEDGRDLAVLITSVTCEPDGDGRNSGT